MNASPTGSVNATFSSLLSIVVNVWEKVHNGTARAIQHMNGETTGITE